MIWWQIKNRLRRVDTVPWVGRSPLIARSMKPQITWLGHSTFLIQFGGFNILTDPIAENLSPLFKRTLPFGAPLDELPEIDFVLISHNHRDHMDAHTLREIVGNNPRASFLIPQGTRSWFSERGFDRTYECMWWDNHRFNAPLGIDSRIEFSFVPAHHWSQRWLDDRNKTLWGGWMMTCQDTKIYFVGDSAYTHFFKQINSVFKPIDIVLMPIGPCEPREFMRHAHVDARESVQAFLDLEATHFIPMHWGTFLLGADYFLTPLEQVKKVWDQRLVGPLCQLHIPRIGERIAPLECVGVKDQVDTSVYKTF